MSNTVTTNTVDEKRNIASMSTEWTSSDGSTRVSAVVTVQPARGAKSTNDLANEAHESTAEDPCRNPCAVLEVTDVQINQNENQCHQPLHGQEDEGGKAANMDDDAAEKEAKNALQVATEVSETARVNMEDKQRTHDLAEAKLTFIQNEDSKNLQRLEELEAEMRKIKDKRENCQPKIKDAQNAFQKSKRELLAAQADNDSALQAKEDARQYSNIIANRRTSTKRSIEEQTKLGGVVHYLMDCSSTASLMKLGLERCLQILNKSQHIGEEHAINALLALLPTIPKSFGLHDVTKLLTENLRAYTKIVQAVTLSPGKERVSALACVMTMVTNLDDTPFRGKLLLQCLQILADPREVVSTSPERTACIVENLKKCPKTDLVARVSALWALADWLHSQNLGKLLQNLLLDGADGGEAVQSLPHLRKHITSLQDAKLVANGVRIGKTLWNALQNHIPDPECGAS